MAIKRAEVLTPWQETVIDADAGIIYIDPLVALAFPLLRFTDITGQDGANLPPSPNLFSALIECDETVLAQIEADPRFYVLSEEYV